MPKAAAKQEATVCPTCGQPIKQAATELAKLFRRYAEKKGLSQAEVARRTGRSGQTIGFLFTGRQGSSGVYLGLKRVGKEKPIAVLVKEALSVPDNEFEQAVGADSVALAMGRLAG